MDNFGIWEDGDDEQILKLQYDSDHPEFARGVQVGMIWQILYSEIEEFEIPVYASNAEMVMRMSEALGYEYSARYEEDSPDGEDHDWMIISFKLRQTV